MLRATKDPSRISLWSLARFSEDRMNHRIAGVAVACAWLLATSAAAQPIRLGELNSYKQFPSFLEPYTKGMELARDEINAAGGVLGRPLEIVSRDETGWEDGNDYTFRLRASTYMQTAMLVPEAAKLNKKRWAIVYPNYEYGQAATATFKAQMIARAPAGIEFVEQAVPLGKIEAGSVVQALIDAKPDAIFSSLFGPDLARFVREGELRGLFKGRPVFDLLGGEPEYLDPLKDEAPVGWWVTGYPWYAIDTPAHNRFLAAYQAKFHDYPRLGSVVGYSTVKTAAAAIKRAGSLGSAKLVAAMRDLDVDTPFGRIRFRAIGHQSTMGAYVGSTAIKDGKGIMVDWHSDDGKDFLPSDAEVRRMRKAAH